MSDTPRTDALVADMDFPWSHSMEKVVLHAERLERELIVAVIEAQNRALEHAAKICDARQDEGHDDGIGPAMCAKAIRSLKRSDAASKPIPEEPK
jgi:hypothetical protein